MDYYNYSQYFRDIIDHLEEVVTNQGDQYTQNNVHFSEIKTQLTTMQTDVNTRLDTVNTSINNGFNLLGALIVLSAAIKVIFKS